MVDSLRLKYILTTDSDLIIAMYPGEGFLLNIPCVAHLYIWFAIHQAYSVFLVHSVPPWVLFATEARRTRRVNDIPAACSIEFLQYETATQRTMKRITVVGYLESAYDPGNGMITLTTGRESRIANQRPASQTWR